MSRSRNVRSTFIALDENESDLAWFLSDVVMTKGKDQQEWYEMVTGVRFTNATDARSTRKYQTNFS